MERFWYLWLVAWCWLTGVFGLVLAGAGFETTGALARFLLGIVAPPALELDPHLRFAFGLSGALTLALAVLYYAAVRAHNAGGGLGRPFWKLALAALLLWYVVDGAISLANGFPLNLVSNTLLTILFVVPVVKAGLLRS